MDAERDRLFLGGDNVVEADSWQLDSPLSSSELLCSSSEKPLQDWVVDPSCHTHNDSDSEDIFHGVDPNQVFPNGLHADTSSESDSGISDDPVVETPASIEKALTTASSQTTMTTVYQVIYDVSGLGSVKAEPGQENIISIELDEWNSQVLFPDSCIINELPVPAAQLSDSLEPDTDLPYLDLQLTEEEQKLLTQEGISLPNNLPLTKAEERILKKVRRKIRNKQSAQDSRRRRKEYLDGLESRAAACSTQNKELQRTVEKLERHNMSLLAQLQQLQSLVRQTVSKGAQTSTCLLIILVSLALIILPSFSPFRRTLSADDDYRPTGVISRNILTDSYASQPAADESHPVTLEPPGDAAALQQPRENSGTIDQEGSRAGNSSAKTLRSKVQDGNHDPSKPTHNDEM
ncbi:cyclic AMP-responsive element-binding protein 3-like protein 4 [Betta splendens]|uniref:Cyclic AMP-responsive element-binding protein 3-like protein 4 n=1 Tax=Betta splendens TaxID=158456 RepID=A0A6P7KS45_BETSP|nr:cyclic AMP-responsive element-binding protein 3-like protein 4 [Betta splendens]